MGKLPRLLGTLAFAAAVSAAAPAEAQRRTAAPRRAPGDPERLEVQGFVGAYFYRAPVRGAARVLVYLHPRNGDPLEGCRHVREVLGRFGWVLCPLGPVDRGGGRREWRNDRDYGERETLASVEALARRFGSRVRRRDNVVMGFSEGSLIAMQTGLRHPEVFPRWFIVAPDDRYLGGGSELLERASSAIRRVYLLTGETDVTMPHSRVAARMLERAWGRRRVRFRELPGVGHELPPEFARDAGRAVRWVLQ